MSFKVSNTIIERAVKKAILDTSKAYGTIAFCTASISDLPLYIAKNGDTSGNIPDGANTITDNYWTRIPFNQFIGDRKNFNFDGYYFYTPNPGYYYVSINFTLNCTNTDPPAHNLTLSMMNQSDGENNLYFPFTVTGTTTNYSFSGIVPTAFYNNNTNIGEIHFSFNSNDEFTFKVSNISVSISFYV